VCNSGYGRPREGGARAVQETLFIPLAARARETGKERPVLRDPRAAEILASVNFDTEKYGRGWGGRVTVLRTVIFDGWVSDFLTAHPGGTVVEIGTGLNTRFERVDPYSQRRLEQQHKQAARKNMAPRWAWSCDDPRTLESRGLELVQQAAVTRPTPALRERRPRRYRYVLPAARRIMGDLATVTLFRAVCGGRSAGKVVGRAGHHGEQVGDAGQGGGLQRAGGHRRAARHGQVAGGGRAGHDRRPEAEVEGVPPRRTCGS